MAPPFRNECVEVFPLKVLDTNLRKESADTGIPAAARAPVVVVNNGESSKLANGQIVFLHAIHVFKILAGEL